MSSLGKTGFNVIYSGDYQNEGQATGDMALLGVEAELHCHSLEPMASQKPQVSLVQELKVKTWQWKNNRRFFFQMRKTIPVLQTRCFFRAE